MKPFDVSPVLNDLVDHYPTADAILAVAREYDRNARYAMGRLWLSEGIPHSFRSRPALYESLRRWVAVRLDVYAKEVTIIGSGRQGFSLSPGPAFGRPFGVHSDLDLTVVSMPMFERLRTAFTRWSSDYTKGLVAPRSDREKRFWDANIDSVSSGLARRFIDPHKIPTLNRYPEAQVIGQTLYEAHEKLKMTAGAPNVRKLSLRTYRDWDSFMRQMAINLESAARVRYAS